MIPFFQHTNITGNGETDLYKDFVYVQILTYFYLSQKNFLIFHLSIIYLLIFSSSILSLFPSLRFGSYQLTKMTFVKSPLTSVLPNAEVNFPFHIPWIVSTIWCRRRFQSPWIILFKLSCSPWSCLGFLQLLGCFLQTFLLAPFYILALLLKVCAPKLCSQSCL